MRLSILTTCYNNSRLIAEFTSQVLTALGEITSDFEVVIVDDGSQDSSWEKIELLSKNTPQVYGVKLSRNFGQHPAILAGLDEVSGDVIVLMDSDLDDDPSFIPSLVKPILEDQADIALTMSVNPSRNRITSRIFHGLIQRATNSPSLKNVGTYRAFNRDVLLALRQYRDHSAVFGPLSTQIGYRITTVSIPASLERRQPSNYNFRKRLSLSLPVLLNEASLPFKAVKGLTLVMFLLVFGLSGIAITRFLTAGGDPLSTTSLVFLVIVLNQVILGLGIAMITLYARTILRETLRRPRYHVSERSKRSLH